MKFEIWNVSSLRYLYTQVIRKQQSPPLWIDIGFDWNLIGFLAVIFKLIPVGLTQWWSDEGINTLPAKNMEYLLFHRFFAFLWGVQGFSVLEIHSYEQILFLGELSST